MLGVSLEFIDLFGIYHEAVGLVDVVNSLIKLLGIVDLFEDALADSEVEFVGGAAGGDDFSVRVQALGKLGFFLFSEVLVALSGDQGDFFCVLVDCFLEGGVID